MIYILFITSLIILVCSVLLGRILFKLQLLSFFQKELDKLRTETETIDYRQGKLDILHSLLDSLPRF